MHVIAAKAVCFHEALQPGFKDYARAHGGQRAGARRGLAERGFRLVSGGTDNHLHAGQLSPNKGLTGKEMEELLEQVGITVNKNTIPFDPQSPFVTSGVRLGTPAVTTRGMGPAQMDAIAAIMDAAVAARGDEDALAKLRGRSGELCRAFPLYPDLG